MTIIKYKNKIKELEYPLKIYFLITSSVVYTTLFGHLPTVHVVGRLIF